MAGNSTQLLLTRVDHESKMINVIRNLYGEGMLTDVTLSCEGQIIHAHRLVLAAVSSYFQSIFQSPVVSNQPNPVVILKDMKLTDLNAIIEFVYSGEVRVAESQLDSLVKSAETLDISGLSRICTNPMSQFQSPPTKQINTIPEPVVLKKRDASSQASVDKVDIGNNGNSKNDELVESGGKKFKFQFQADTQLTPTIQTRKSNLSISLPKEEGLTDTLTTVRRSTKRLRRCTVSGGGNNLEKDSETGKTLLPKAEDPSYLSISSGLSSVSSSLSPVSSPKHLTTSSNQSKAPKNQKECEAPLAKLILVEEGESTTPKELVIHQNEFSIGRDRSCDYRINDSQVSFHHCLITLEEGNGPKLIIKAKNVQTRVNGKSIAGEAKLNDGDIIEIADKKLRFQSTCPIIKASPLLSNCPYITPSEVDDEKTTTLLTNERVKRDKTDHHTKRKTTRSVEAEPSKSSVKTNRVYPHARNGENESEIELIRSSSTPYIGLRSRKPIRKNLRRICAERSRRHSKLRFSQKR